MNKSFTFWILCLFLIQSVIGQTRTSVANGAWNNPSTWDCGCIPASGENVIIATGTTVDLTTNQTINNVELIGNLNLNTNARTLTVNGNFNVSGSSTIFGGGTSRVINIAGNLVINNTASLDLRLFNMTVTGTTTNNGNFLINNANGVRTFIGKIINNGTWSSTIVTNSANFVIRNGIDNFGTLNLGALRFNTNNQAIGGTSPIIFNSTTIIDNITLTNNNPIITFNATGSINGTTAGSTLSAGTGTTINYAYNTRPMITGTIALGSTPNTFRYNRAGNQDVRTGDYYDLIIQGTGNKTFTGVGSVNVVNNLTVENTISILYCNGKDTNTGGTFTLSAEFNHTEGITTQHQMTNFVLDGGYLDLGNTTLDGFVINNNFTVTTNGGNIDTGGEPLNGFSVGGNTNIHGNFVFSNTNSNSRAFFNGLVTIMPTGSWNSTASAPNQTLRFRANIVNNGTFNAGGATFDVNNQNISGNTFNFASVDIDNVILDNLTTAYLTLNGVCLSGTGTWNQNPNTFLYIRGDAQVNNITATAIPNTVTYYQNRNNQEVNPGVYYDLVIDKTTGTDANIAGSLAGTVNVINSLVIQNGQLGLNTAGDQLIVGANGTTSILTANSILYFSNASTTAILNTLLLGNGGTIDGGANGNCFAQTLTTFGTGGNLGRCNFTVNGLTTLNANLNFTNAAGSKNFVGLVDILPGVTWNSTIITATGGLNFRGGINNNGTSFTAHRATFEVNNQTLTGTTDYIFNQTLRLADNIELHNQGVVYLASTGLSLDGVGDWIQDANSFLYIQGDATTSSINSLAAPNTVTYYGGVTQDVNPGTYHHLVINKTVNTYANVAGASAGTITVNGNLTINSGIFSLNTAGDQVQVIGNTYINQGGNTHLRFDNAATLANLNHLFLNNNGRIHGSANGQANVATFTVSSTGGVLSRCNFTVNGTSTLNGNLLLDNDNGIKRFDGMVTINAAASWNSNAVTTTGNLIFRGGITNNGTSFVANIATFNTNNQDITGSTQLLFNNTVTINNIQVNNYTNVDLATTAVGLLGTGTAQWIQQPSSYLRIAGDVNAVTMGTSAFNNTVEYYNNVQQNVGTGTYYHLLINKSGSRADIAGPTSGTVNVNGSLVVQQGELRLNTAGDQIHVDPSAFTLITGNTSRLEFTAVGIANLSNFTFSNSAAIGTGTSTATGNIITNTFTVSGTGTMNLGRCNFTTNGVTNLNAPLNLNSNTGVKTFNELVTVGLAGSWTSTVITTPTNLVFRNGVFNNNTFSASAATFNTNDQSISGNPFDFSGQIIVNNIELTNQTTVNHNYAIAAALTGTGTWTQGVNSVYNTNAITITISNMNASAMANTVNYNRNNTQTVFHPINGEYYNLTLSGASTKIASAGNKIILNDILITGTAIFNVSTNSVNLEIRGNWTNSSSNIDPFTEGTQTVTFNGSNPQTISNTADQQGTDFYNLVIDNSSATGVIITGNAGLHTRIVANGTLTLNNGYVYTNSDNMIVILNTGNSTGGNINSFVNGPIRKIGNQAFIFPTGQDVLPIGKGTEDVWARIGISAPATNTTQFTAQYFYTPYGDMTKDATLTHVSFHEYWTLDRAVTTNAVQVTLYYESATRSFITDYTSGDLVVARYTASNLWTSEGQSARSNTDPGWVTSNVVSNFSPFTFGSITGGNPFPVELVNFSANLQGNKVKLQWTTASEINTDYFQIEKSLEGLQFEKVFTQNAAGYSNMPIDYEGFDYEPFKGISYYRLKTVDRDGKFVYSNVVAVNFQSEFAVSIYPNPTKDNLNIHLSEKSNDVDVSIYDLTGRLVFQENYLNTNNIELSTQNWNSGLYIAKIKTLNGEFTEKIVKE